MSRIQIEKGVAYTLELYPPEGMYDHGIGDAETCYVYTSGSSSLAGGAASRDALASSTNITTAAEGARTIVVASTVGLVVGRRYIATSSDGRWHEVTIAAISGGTGVVLFEGVRWSMTGGTLHCHRLTYNLSAADTASARRFLRVVWRYKVLAKATMQAYLIDIVEWPFSLDVGEAEVLRGDVFFTEQIGKYGNWGQLRDVAREDVWMHLEGLGVKPDLVRSRDLVRQAYIYRILFHRHALDEARREHYRRLYDEAMSRFHASRDAWYDSDDDLACSTTGWTTAYVGTLPVSVETTSEGGGIGEASGIPGSALKEC